MPGMPSPTNHIMMVMAGGAGNQVMGLHPVCVDAASNGNGNGQSAVASSQHATVFSTVDALFGLAASSCLLHSLIKFKVGLSDLKLVFSS